MITIISGTNRPGSNTLKIAKHYQTELASLGVTAQLLSLEALTSLHKDDNFVAIEKQYLIPTTKFIILSPEYNGAFAGILKLMIDLSNIKEVWNGKKAALVGVASGRAGNARGLDALTNMLHYTKVNVLPNKLPISSVHTLLNEEGALIDESTKIAIAAQIKEFIDF
jgi:NAD(P)H-dependent FMN reductase